MSPAQKQAAPFLVFAILALLVSAHAGCTGGMLEELPNGDGGVQQPNNPNPNPNPDDGPDYYYGYDGYYHYG